MDLHGWKYTGRNIDDKLHEQYVIMVDCLLNKINNNHQLWGGKTQLKVAKYLESTEGTVRTIKKIAIDFRFFNKSINNLHCKIIR